MVCPFYQRTRDGKRCILIPPEEWKEIKDKVQSYCNGNFKECRIYIEKYASIVRKYGIEK